MGSKGDGRDKGQWGAEGGQNRIKGTREGMGGQWEIYRGEWGAMGGQRRIRGATGGNGGAMGGQKRIRGTMGDTALQQVTTNGDG